MDHTNGATSIFFRLTDVDCEHLHSGPGIHVQTSHCVINISRELLERKHMRIAFIHTVF